MEHTKEPWSIEPCYEAEDCFDVMSNGKWFIATTHDGVNGQSNAEANARRIVAAVNACAGIPLERLEQVPPINAAKDWVDTVLQWKDQRDELQLERDNYKSVAEAHSGAFQECIRLREQRDELLAAFEQSNNHLIGEGIYPRQVAINESAIAKVKP